MQSLDKEKKWKKASDTYSEVVITNNNFSPFDIHQGSLSNCYYLSALAAIAKFPSMILKLFPIVDIEKLQKTSSSKSKINLEDFLMSQTNSL